MFRTHTPILAALAAALLAACYVGGVSDGDGANAAPGDAGGAGARGAAGRVSGEGPPTGLPCDVDALLATHCRACHHAGQSSLPALVTYEDLTGPSKFEPARRLADVAAERLAEGSMPPAPNAPPSDDERAALGRWIEAGTPRGTCGAAGAGADGGPVAAVDAGPAPLVCTSGETWTSNRRGPTMNPGRACIACHVASEDEPILQVGGTVYPTLHEPNLCLGVPGMGVRVEITDATGRVVQLPVGPTGNFSLEEKAARLVMPIRAKVVTADGRERVMRGARESGDCNACHTEQGANGAPGRIVLP